MRATCSKPSAAFVLERVRTGNGPHASRQGVTHGRPYWCRVALLQVYWERVEEMGRWAVGALQWKPNKVILRPQQWSWDGGWLPGPRGVSQTVDKGGVRVLEIACWQVRVLDHSF